MKTALAWYHEYIDKGVTPPVSGAKIKDVLMFDHLANLTTGEADIRRMVDELGEVESRIKAIEQENAALYSRQEELKTALKDFMKSNSLTEMESMGGAFTASLREQIRSKVDPMLMKSAGIDPAPFTVETVSNVFTVKKRK